MEFDVHLSEALLRRIALRRTFRRWPLSVAALVLIGSAVYLDLESGSLGPVSIIGLCAVGMQWILYAAHCIRQYRAIADWKRLQGEAPVHYTLDDDKLRASSNLGATELKWNVFQGLFEHSDFLLLTMGRGVHLTLPRPHLPVEAETVHPAKVRVSESAS